jgi:anti-sigma B factor antagonist
MIEAIVKGIWVCQAQDSLFIRVVGRGTFQNSRALRSYVQEALSRGVLRYFVDLGPCQGMDSTFLGVLAGIGLRLRQQKTGSIQVVNAAPRNLELLQTLGLDQLFAVSSAAPPVWFGKPAPPDPAFQLLPESDIETLSKPLDRDETADLMLEAHENLQQADGRNAAKFQDLTKMLRAGVEQRQAKTKGPG